MHIRWTTAALADIANILEHAHCRNPQEARNLRRRIEQTERNILTFPRAAYFNKTGDYYERYIPRTRVILVYRIISLEVMVIAAFHTSRNPKDKP